jgi:hypothetical protein
LPCREVANLTVQEELEYWREIAEEAIARRKGRDAGPGKTGEPVSGARPRRV